jgi:hypothetical protein
LCAIPDKTGEFTKDARSLGVHQYPATPKQQGGVRNVDYPETPEAIALILLCLILAELRPGCLPNGPPSARILDIYAECLRAVLGDRDVSHIHH